MSKQTFEEPTDRELVVKGEGFLTISFRLVADLLRLPQGLRIIAATAYSCEECVTFLVVGEGMPKRAYLGAKIADVEVICNVELAEGRRIVWASLSHRPEERWVMQDIPWPPAPKEEGVDGRLIHGTSPGTDHDDRGVPGGGE